MREKEERNCPCRKILVKVIASLLAVVCWLRFRKRTEFPKKE